MSISAQHFLREIRAMHQIMTSSNNHPNIVRCLDPKRYTLKPKRYTLKPKPYTLMPKPEILKIRAITS